MKPLPERCATKEDCLCSGGKHVLCLTASRKNADNKAFLLSFSKR